MFLRLLWYQRFRSQLDLIVHLILHIFSHRDRTDQQRSILAWSSRREHRSGETTVRRRFLFLPHCRIVSLLHSSPRLQGFFRRVGNIVVRLVTREVRKHCVHLLQNELQVLYSSFLAKKALISLDHCWKSSSLPENSFSSPRSFVLMRLGASLRTWAVVRLYLSFESGQLPADAESPFAPSKSSSLLLRMRFRKYQSTSSPCVSPHARSTSNRRPEDYPVHQSRSKLSSPGQLPPRNHESEQRFAELCTPRTHTITSVAPPTYDFMSQHAVNLFLEPLRSVRICE